MQSSQPYLNWQEHFPELRAFALHLTRDEERAKDLLQDTVYLVIKNWSGFRAGSNFSAWVKTILRNVFISKYRLGQRRSELIKRDRPQGNWIGVHTAENPAESSLGAEEIMRLLQHLSTVNRRAFLLYYQGFRYHEIARLTGTPVGTAKSRVHTARLQLRKMINRQN